MKAVKLIPKYLWQYKFVIAVFFVFAIIFAGIAYLYHLDIAAILYSTLLCAVAAIIMIAIHFYCYCKKHNERLRLLEYAQTLELPSPQNLTEADLLAVIEKLREQCKLGYEAKRQEKTEYLDYYTMWMHQIKTPIAAMGLMLQGEDTKENRALAGELFRIEQYVEMALWYLRMDDMSDTVFMSYDLDGIIKDAVRKFAPSFVSKKIKLDYSPANITVITDKKWLSFIIEQLLANAIKYTEKGSITIKVENKILSIADTGIGIAKEDIPRIFEKGYTGYNGRVERKSTGIGLYLCRRAANKLSHKISVTSLAGEGSTFYIDLNTYNLQAE
ncbi:MAG: sensor histidine kinase [Clostridia bacterium]|nr:sensor histidine kinase [Clostridia bacterium]